MGFGGRGGGEGSSRPDEGGSEGKKVKLSADDVLRIVAQHRKQVLNNPHWKKEDPATAGQALQGATQGAQSHQGAQVRDGPWSHRVVRGG
jgi:hypothetical protein